MPNGKCRLHGGKSLAGVDSPTFIHGRYSKYIPQQIRAKVDTDTSDPFDLLPELQVQRALFVDYLSHFQDPLKLPQDAVNMLIVWANDIGKMVERITKMRNETALTKAEVAFIAARIANVVSKYIPDVDTQRAFVADLLTGIGRPALPDRATVSAEDPAARDRA